jgi:hypothetical protein
LNVDSHAWVTSRPSWYRVPIGFESTRGVPGIATASIKGTWQVKKGTTGAVLLMNKPRIKRLTQEALGKLAQIELLQSMHLVTKVFYCPAYSLYLSDKSQCIIPSGTNILI